MSSSLGVTKSLAPTKLLEMMAEVGFTFTSHHLDPLEILIFACLDSKYTLSPSFQPGPMPQWPLRQAYAISWHLKDEVTQQKLPMLIETDENPD